MQIKMKSFTVTEITRYIKRLLSTDPIVNQVIVEGEISNFIRHSSGHAYFTLKDDQSKLACVMFSQYVEGLGFIPKNGDKVHAKGQISVYERDGRYQLNAFGMENIGLGALHIQFEALKKTLAEQGYFDESQKKVIPMLPQKVGIITSPTGAAIQDILSVAQRRSNFSDLLIYPVRVQGETAKYEIANGIRYFNERSDIDLIILARGGGSIEELWAFNEASVAKAIFDSKIPIITGIGHETDFTISDFVADLRAATPSAAAEIAIKSKLELTLSLNRTLQKITLSVRRNIEVDRAKIQRFEPDRLKHLLLMTLDKKAEQLKHQEILYAQKAFDQIRKEKEKLAVLGAKLDSLSPFAVLRRGYAVVSKEGQLISSTEQLSLDDNVAIRLLDGEIGAVVKSKNKSSLEQ